MFNFFCYVSDVAQRGIAKEVTTTKKLLLGFSLEGTNLNKAQFYCPNNFNVFKIS